MNGGETIMRIAKWFLLFGLIFSGSLYAADFQAGVAKVAITPPPPFWLTGYAARTKPADSVRMELWAKALAIQDDQGGRAVIITTDLIGLPQEITDAVAGRLAKSHGLRRSEVLFNSSHTHAGPVIWPNLRVMFDFDEKEQTRVRDYAYRLAENLTAVAGQALANLAPAQLSCGQGSAEFATNRREPTTTGVIIGVNPKGPTDHSVPVLRVVGTDGVLRAVLFGYACHNTTTGGDFYQVNGDYAGAAQLELETAHPGATVMFLMLCGGDQNPSPRGTVVLADQYGRTLAAAVERVLAGELKDVRSPIRSAYRTVDLELASHTREQFQAESKNADKYRQRRARLMLEAYDQGKPVRTMSYPIQVLRFNSDLTLIAMGGEVVVDYSLRAKREFPAENLVVAGYCNDVSGYIPSLRILLEGGYEPVVSMIYYGQPGPFAENVEEVVFQCFRDLMSKVGVR
jgi:neutral ceramidase